MNFSKILCLTLCFLISYFPLCKATQYISLGRDCQATGQLRDHNLRTAAYPIDWMVSHNFYGVIQVIQDEFKYFLDPAFLVYQTNFIENSYYHFLYNHFFPIIGHPVTEDVHVAGIIVPNYLDFLPAVQNTQAKRIKRFLNLLSSKEKVVFIRTHSCPSEALTFTHVMKIRYPQLDFLLVVVHERPDLIGNWNIPSVMNFYASQKIGFADWWSNAEWLNIFNQIQSFLVAEQALKNNKR